MGGGDCSGPQSCAVCSWLLPRPTSPSSRSPAVAADRCDRPAPDHAPPPPPEPPPPPPPEPPTPLPSEQPGRSAPIATGPGSPISASAGEITQADLEDRPVLRTADFLEEIPGLIVTQHSSQGKANQYFLRGFSLDHGTDFAGYVDDVPYNLPTNAHGQGYLDLNSVIPELIDHVDFHKGPYYADVGDFSSAGSASIHLMDRMPYGIFKIETGMYDWERVVVANSEKVGPGDLLYAIEANYYNGAFQLKEDFNRFVGVLKYTLGDRDGDDWLSLSLIGYDASGNSVNQVPQRAIEEGQIDQYGVRDPSDFLTTSRYTFDAQFQHRGDDGSVTKANAYAYYYSLNIFSNFTFFLQDPVHGDQLEQIDRRWVTGDNVSHQWNSLFWGDNVVNTVGLQVRNDYIPHVGLHHTEDRQLVNVVTDDTVEEFNAGVVRPERGEMGGEGAHHHRGARQLVLRRRGGLRHAGELGEPGRADFQPERLADPGSVEQDGVLP